MTTIVLLWAAGGAFWLAWASALPRTRNLGVWLLSPSTMGLVFVLASGLGFPLLWRLGIGAPWNDLNNEVSAIAVTVGFVVAAICGASATRHRPGTTASSWPTLSPTASTAGLLLGALGLGLLYLASPQLFGSAGDLVRRQGDGLTAGSGPLYVLLTVPVWVVVFGRSTTRLDHLVRIAALAQASGTIFLTGQKSRFVILAVFLLVRHSDRLGGLAPRAWLKLIIFGAALVVGTTAYNIEVRGGGNVRPVEGTDPSSIPGYVEYSIARFGQSTFDMTRTVGAVDRHDPTSFRFDPSPLAGSILAPLPSRLVTKPPPASHVFSAEYLPEVWQRGSGVPPSLAAELMSYLGLPLSYLVFGLFFLLLRHHEIRHPPGAGGASVVDIGLRLTLVASTIMLLKGGSDGTVRIWVILAGSLLIVSFLQRAVERAPTAQATRSPAARSLRLRPTI